VPCNEIKSANPFLRESFPEKITAAIDRPKVQSRSKEARIESNRPPVSAGRLDQRLAGLVLALRGMVAETQSRSSSLPKTFMPGSVSVQALENIAIL